eukprot:UN04185
MHTLIVSFEPSDFATFVRKLLEARARTFMSRQYLLNYLLFACVTRTRIELDKK